MLRWHLVKFLQVDSSEEEVNTMKQTCVTVKFMCILHRYLSITRMCTLCSFLLPVTMEKVI